MSLDKILLEKAKEQTNQQGQLLVYVLNLNIYKKEEKQFQNDKIIERPQIGMPQSTAIRQNHIDGKLET
jgi:hypothetical protein